jgi:hypothetical protein
MATKKKPGAKKPAKRKKRVSGTVVNAVKIAGKTFTKQSCHTTKTAATAQANRIRAQGNNARVIKSGKVSCVFKGGKTSPKAPRAALTATRRRRAA